jgi:hypothetical protein
VKAGEKKLLVAFHSWWEQMFHYLERSHLAQIFAKVEMLVLQ